MASKSSTKDSKPSSEKPKRSPENPIRKSAEEGYLAGQLLVAMPGMTDPRFRRSVIFLCGHDDQGAMGIVINKVLESVCFEDLADQLELDFQEEVPSLCVHYGGPVEIGRGFILHSTEYDSDSSVDVTQDIALSATVSILEDVVEDKGPDHLMLALGYAGWGADQLESEIKRNGWLTLPADASLVFDANPETLWHRVLAKFGIDPEHLTSTCGHA